MTTGTLLDRLASLPALAAIPREQLQWLLDHGQVLRADDGAGYRGVDGAIGLILLISGRFSVRVDENGASREVREVTAGQVTGQLPYSRMKNPRGYLVADGPVEFLSIPPDLIKDMTRACYEFTEVCVQAMLERARVFRADDKRLEKMAALGRLSAGLAHELNNPASAAVRAGRELESERAALVSAARELGAAGLTSDAQRALEALEAATRERASAALSPVDRMVLEDGLVEWLDARELDSDLAHPLVDRGITRAGLDAVAALVDASALAAVVRYLAADSTVRQLSAQVAAASERIHAVVAAVKAHTHMDRAAVEPIPLAPHLADTITLMTSKAAPKGVSVELSVERDLPLVEASVAELNQVWTHLVDNAIDAVAKSGRVTIDARREDEGVVVRVVDDGPGIPAERQEQVFEPFFTTKDVGVGRGLGLDVVQTVVRNHRGTVKLTSVPGRTEFRVTLPAAPVVAKPVH